MTEAEPVTRAREIIADLERKRTETSARLANIGNERALIAYDAETGDAAAAKTLASLNAEGAEMAQRLDGLDAALVEARRRLAAATEAEAVEAIHAKAGAVLPLVERFRAMGADLDKQSAVLVEAFRAFAALGREIAALSGAHATDAAVLGTNTRRALSAHFHGTLPVEFIAKSERFTLAEVARQTSAQAETWANRTLGHIEEEAA